MSGVQQLAAADAMPCPPMQAGLLFETLSRGQDVYLQQVLVTLPEPVSVAGMREAWAAAIARHEVLQTAFVLQASRALGLRVRPACVMEISERDWSDLGEDKLEARWDDLVGRDRQAGMALEVAPLMRACLCHVSRGARLLWTYHHALLDGRSRCRVLHEVFTPTGAAPGAPFRPYAEWAHAQTLAADARLFWRGLLADLEQATPPPPSLGLRGEPDGPPGWARRALARGTTDRLRGLAGSSGLSLGVLIQAAFSILLGQEAASDDLLYAATRAARRSPPFPAEEIVGLLMVTVPVRIRIDQTRPFAALMRELRDLSRRTRPFEHSPLVEVQRESEIAAGQPLAETMFSFERLTTQQALRRLDSAWEDRGVEVIERPGYGLTIKAYGDPEVVLSANWDGVRCRSGAGERFLERLVCLLEEIAVTGLDQPAGWLATLSDARRRELSGEGDSAADPSRPGDLVPKRIAAAIGRYPERVAISHRGEQVTYHELGQRLARIAESLADLGVGEGHRVGIATARTPDMVAAVLAVHRIGAAYVPIDPDYPPERTRLMMLDSELHALVSDRASVKKLHRVETPLLLLDGAAGTRPPSRSAEPYRAAETDLSHVIYTSGSTGLPKGVAIGHHGLRALTAWAESTFTDADRDGLLASTSLSFDLSVFELLVTLALGGRVVLVDDLSEILSPDFTEHVVHVNTVPSVAASLLIDREPPPTVRIITFAGEVLEREVLRRAAAFPGVVQVWNLYGPSEDTTFSTAAVCDPQADGAVPIGRPLPGTQAYILNDALRPVPVGVRGELFIGGAGLAHGYHRLPELTAERFVTNPFDGSPSRLLYRTGDLAAWREDGALEFHGRRDDQVKLRGIRVEPGEVRHALLEDARLSEATVQVREAGGHPVLIAYVVAQHRADVTAAEIRSRVASRLPDHAVPASIVVLDSLPRTPSGKLDHRALPKPSIPTASGPAVTAVERELAGIWQALLELDAPPGLSDDFFSSGGDSLDALSLMVIIEERWGLQVPASVMLRAASLRAMAAAIEHEDGSVTEHLVPLNLGGSKTPWFCVVIDHEQALGLRKELPSVMPGRGAYSLACLPLGFSPAELDVAALATVGLEYLVAKQASGPYLLGGYSVGGAVAWEMSCRLTAAGQEVALLAIIDARAPHLQRWLPDLARRALPLRTSGTIGRIRVLDDLIRISILRARRWARAKGMWAVAEELSAVDLLSLLGRYRPPEFTGPVLVFHTDSAARETGSRALGWQRYARGPLTTHLVGGEHHHTISAAYAATFSVALGEALDRTGT